MAQNALTAAESLGLGGVYIGGVRANITELTEVLNLPKHVVPLVGLCIGYPSGEKPGLKPRLPQSMVMFENQYQPLDEEKLVTMTNRCVNINKIVQNAPFTVKKVRDGKIILRITLKSNCPLCLSI